MLWQSVIPNLVLGSRKRGLNLLSGGPDGAGLSYAEKIQALFGSAIVGYWPQWENYSPVAGTGTITQLTTNITGVGTKFLTECKVGARLIATGIDGYVVSITNDLALVISSSATQAAAQAYTITDETSTDISGRGHNGLYRAVTLGQPGIGDGRTAASFDGATSFNNVYSAGLNTDFNGQEGSYFIWMKVSAAGVWTDATIRYASRISVNASNLVDIYKTGTNNVLEIDYTAGGTTQGVGFTSAAPLAFFHFGVTWSKSNNAMKVYFNGVQQGATQTGLGTWAGALSTTQAVIGSATTGAAAPWSGRLAHALLLNRAATAAEIAIAATVP